MQSEMPFFDGPDDALREAVRALGGPKAVGPMLWPDMDLDAAKRKLHDAINPNRDEKLAFTQILLILRKARDTGYHAAFQYLAADVGYDARPITRQEEEDRITTTIATASSTLAAALATLERLRDGASSSASGVRVVR
jgi:hypothetical protein